MDLNEDKGTKSSILAEGLEWFEKGLLDLKQVKPKGFVNDQPIGVTTSLGLTLAFSRTYV